MNSTRKSLYYVVFYLSLGGLGLFVVPELALKVLFSNQDYGSIMPRMVGLLMLALGFLIYQLIVQQAFQLYKATILARLLIVAGMVWLYFVSKDPLFLTLIIIVGLGLFITSFNYLKEKK